MTDEEFKPKFKPFNRDEHDRNKSEVLRDAKTGKWLPGGGSPNPKGRAKREVEEAAFNTLASVLTEEEWALMVGAMIKLAKGGNVTAFTTLAHYYAGKPTEHIEVNNESEQRIVLSFGDESDLLSDPENKNELGSGE